MQFLYLLEGIRTPFLDAVIGAVTRLGEETVAIVVVCVLFWCVSKEMGYGIGMSFFLSGIAVQAMKVTFRVPRPWVLDPDFKAVEAAVPAATGYSFPSGHTQTATSIFGTLGLYFKGAWPRIVCIGMALLVGFSRMYLGVHTPADVGVGFAVSLVIALITWSVLGRIGDTERYDLIISLVMALASLAAMGYIFSIRELIEAKYIADSCKMVGSSLGFAVAFYLERRHIRFDPATPKWWHQPVKCAVGLGVALGLKSGLKLILGTSPLAGAARYFLLVVWIVAVFPLLCKRVLRSSTKQS